MTIETITVYKQDPTPIYKQIADQIAHQIESGELASNSKLPTHRWLADQLHVTVGTITRAYSEIERRGLVEARVGAGTYVADSNKPSWAFEESSVDPNEYNFGYNIPPQLDRSDMLKQAMQRISTSPAHLNQLMIYQPPSGLDAHRSIVTKWLNSKGIKLHAHKLLFSSGAQHAIQMVLDTFTRAGDTVLVEKYTYPGVISLARQNQLTLKGVEMDEFGVTPESLEVCCQRYSPRFIYLTPTLQNPTTAIMPKERRLDIIRVCEQYNVYIIEDEINGLLLESPPAPMVNYAPERVVHIGAFSKCLAPGLRVGYIHAPEKLYQKLLVTLQTHSWMISPLLTALTCEMLTSGDAERNLTLIHREMKARIDIATRALDGFELGYQTGGFHIWLTLPENWRLSEFVSKAQEMGIIVKSGELFAPPGGSVAPAVRLSLSSPQTIEQLQIGVDKLKALLLSNTVDEFTL
ncbi:PLP-dependent aminotransferase family protein [Vibrio sp. CyArs1]|uniref:aminotransferase-like domain-containing protein n=1 Tax=Vibrio sp. CyArs1 TaxID=2682577 RepID=UPI001F055F59|nr:PLP-dependent aminotransferase family protein [Vibrio sp. CyArs1]